MKPLLIWGTVAALSLTSPMASADDSISFTYQPDARGPSALIVKIISTTETHYPVTDLSLDMLSWEGSVEDALKAANQPGRDPFVTGFSLRLMVVANGRLFRDGYAICSTWEDDISICGIECDGGHFVLTRALGAKTQKLTVTLGPMPGLIADHRAMDILIGDCGEDRYALLAPAGSDPVSVEFSRWSGY